VFIVRRSVMYLQHSTRRPTEFESHHLTWAAMRRETSILIWENVVEMTTLGGDDGTRTHDPLLANSPETNNREQ